MAGEEEYNVEKREKRSNFIFPIILRLLARISSGEEDVDVDVQDEEGKKIKIKM